MEAKAGLRSITMIRDSNARCPRGYRLSHNTSSKVQTQGITAKKPRAKEPRPKETKQADDKAPAPPRSDKPIKLTCQEKKKKYQKKKQDQKNSFPAIGDNVIKGKKDDKKCYNCQKKSYIAKNCPKPPKNECQSQQPPCRWLMMVKRLWGCPVSIIRFDSRKARSR